MTKVFLLIVGVASCQSLLSLAHANTHEPKSFVSDQQASYRVQSSFEAQDGEPLLVIDGTKLTLPIECPAIGNFGYCPFRPSGYVYQTVEAKPYSIKHLHVSGFARAIKPNFSQMEKHFSDYLEGAQQARLVKFLGETNAYQEAQVPSRFKLVDDDHYQKVERVPCVY